MNIFKKQAFEALNNEINESNNFWDSYEAIDRTIRNFITGEDDDNEWVSTVINNVGHDYYMFRVWFDEQSNKPEDWSEKQFELITEWNESFKNMEI